MESKATARFILISPRKARLVANEIRGFSYPEAEDSLRFMSQKAAAILLKLLRSALANTLSKMDAANFQADSFYIKKLYIDKGPMLKRYRPQSRGRGASRLKRTSNITLVLSDQ